MTIDEIIEAVEGLMQHYADNPAEGMPEKDPAESPEDFLGRMQEWQRVQGTRKGSTGELAEALQYFKRAHTQS